MSVYLLPLLVTPLISPGQLFLEELQDEEEGVRAIEMTFRVIKTTFKKEI